MNLVKQTILILFNLIATDSTESGGKNHNLQIVSIQFFSKQTYDI